jgi:hypothetical protein
MAGMFSRRTALRRLDNRTVETRSMNRTVRELSEHVGGGLSALDRGGVQPG